MTKMGINLFKKKRFIFVLLLLIVASFLPIINIDQNIQFSCLTVYEDDRALVKCFVEPSDARFISHADEIKLNTRLDLPPRNNYLAKVYKVDGAISYYNGIAYKPVYGEFSEESIYRENVILEGSLKINKVSVFKLLLVNVSNWLEPYTGERIVLS